MRYVIYVEEEDSYLSSDTYSLEKDIMLAKSFSKYNPVRFYYKWELNKKYKKVYFRKFVLLDANISLNDFLRRL